MAKSPEGSWLSRASSEQIAKKLAARITEGTPRDRIHYRVYLAIEIKAHNRLEELHLVPSLCSDK